MIEELNPTEKNALKWILLKDYWLSRKATGTERENYQALVRFLIALEVDK